MRLLDHVSISVSDLDAARRFYDAIMSALGCDKVYDRGSALGYGVRCRPDMPDETYLAIYTSSVLRIDDKRHWCFKATSRRQVEAFYAQAMASGGRCDGPPGLRIDYHPHYFAAFVRDPDGNRLEAVCHLAPRSTPQ